MESLPENPELRNNPGNFTHEFVLILANSAA